MAPSNPRTLRWLWVLASFSITLLVLVLYTQHGDRSAKPLIDQAKAVAGSEHADLKSTVSVSGEPLKEWRLPTMDKEPQVHGVNVSEGLARKPLYPLYPFPESPMKPSREDGESKPWLAAVMCAAWDIERRMLIRYSWMTDFKHLPMDQRFVISNPGPLWTYMVQQENRTFGDLIVLDHLQEDDFTANTVKTNEFFRWLSHKSPRKYQFVSKVDTDLYLNAHSMWHTNILPRLDKKGRSTSNRTIFGQWYYRKDYNLVFSHGAMYSMSWDLVELLPKLQDEHHIINDEDVMISLLLLAAGEQVTFVPLNSTQKFEYDPRDTRPGQDTAWALKGTDPTSLAHALHSKDVIAIHQLKTKERWLKVAKCFDQNGLLDMPPDTGDAPPVEEKPGYPRPWFHRIPPEHWEVDKDGRWICNGIYKLEPGMTNETMR